MEVPCRVLIVDDHNGMRELLAEMLQAEAGIIVVGKAADGPHAIELAGQVQPDVVVIDVNLGGMSGIAVTRAILERNAGTRVIGLSMHKDVGIVNRMRDAGATDYLSKEGLPDNLIAAIHSCGIG